MAQLNPDEKFSENHFEMEVNQEAIINSKSIQTSLCEVTLSINIIDNVGNTLFCFI